VITLWFNSGGCSTPRTTTIRAICARIDTAKEDDRRLRSGRSEKSVIVRADLMTG
jgi:hypothetical protein